MHILLVTIQYYISLADIFSYIRMLIMKNIMSKFYIAQSALPIFLLTNTLKGIHL